MNQEETITTIKNLIEKTMESIRELRKLNICARCGNKEECTYCFFHQDDISENNFKPKKE